VLAAASAVAAVEAGYSGREEDFYKGERERSGATTT
jgi:hypothetical protein